MRRILARGSYYLDLGCQYVATGFFIALLVLVVFQVVTRYVLHNAPVWTEEVARYCMVWGGLLGATVAFKEGSDPFLVPPPTKGNPLWLSGARILRAMATVAFLGPILYHSDKFLLRTWQRSTEALGIPTAFITIAVPLAVAIIFFHLLTQLLARSDPSEGKAQKDMDMSV
ncbi:MAG: C4-dicarboxylate transporter permease [Deltaproteobacteria bacterium]|nr:C4-dicarboxylate transporter permease [Deltaproteobacteria bacterium]